MYSQWCTGDVVIFSGYHIWRHRMPICPSLVLLIWSPGQGTVWFLHCTINITFLPCHWIFKTTRIFYSLTKFPPVFRICWASLPDPVLTMMTAKWWFFQLQHSFPIYLLASAFYCKSPPSSPIYLPVCLSIISLNSWIFIFSNGSIIHYCT